MGGGKWSSSKKSLLLGSALLCRYGVNANVISAWTRQSIPSFYRGDHSGAAVYDLNHDGYNDVLFAAGRYGVDQSYAMINLGYEDEGTFRFSDPIPIGYPGGYFQIDVFPLSSLDEGHVSVLLVGGTCIQPYVCDLGSHEPAVLLDVTVTGCSVTQPDVACQSSFKTIWQDATPSGNRNGAFAPSLGDGTDPAIVLAGSGSVSIFEPKNGAYVNPPVFSAASEGMIPATAGTMQDAVGLSVGHFPDGNFGNVPGIIVGMRTRRTLSPLVAIVRIAGKYEWFDFASSNDTYVEHRSSYPIETPGVAMGDINGDGVVDVVESNYVHRPGILKRNIVPQFYYLLDKEKSLQADITASKLFDAPVSGRSVDIGLIFDDSQLPDIVHGMVDGTLRIFANMGVDSNNTFLGFEEKGALNVGADCEILDVLIANLSPCTVSLICALACDVGNVIFSTPTSCQEGESPPRNPLHTSTSTELADLQLGNISSMAPTMKPSPANPTLVPSQFPTLAPSNRPNSMSPTPYSSASPLPSDSPSSRPTLSSEGLLTSTSTAFSTNMPPSDTPSQSPHSLNSSADIIQNGVSSALPSDFPSLSPTDSPSVLTPSNRVHEAKEPPKDISQASGSSGDEFTDVTSIGNQVRSWQVVLLCFSSITVIFLVLGLANRSLSRREQKRQDRIIQVYTNTSMVPFGSDGITTQESPSIVSVYFVATDDTYNNSPTNVDVGKLLAQALTPLSEHPIRNIHIGSTLNSPAVGRNSGCNTFWDSAYAGTSDLACETADEQDTVFLLNTLTTSPTKRKSGRYKPEQTTLTRPVPPSSNTAAQF